MYLGVTPSRRFLAFIIDFFIIMLIASFITFGILFLIKFDFNRYNTLQDWLINSYYDIAFLNSQSSQTEMMNNLKEFAGLYFIIEGIRLAVAFVLYFLYLVILPYFFKYQTVGRLAVKAKVIYEKNPEEKLKFSTLVLREMVGSFLCYSLFNILGFISMILAVASGKSIVDRISKTNMVLDIKIPVNEEFKARFFTNMEENNNDYKEEKDYIDAEVKEINEEPKKDNIDDSDEYRVI